ncbi:hypothetical protein ACOJVU_04210, partial [Mycobacterium sp. THU-M104]
PLGRPRRRVFRSAPIATSEIVFGCCDVDWNPPRNSEVNTNITWHGHTASRPDREKLYDSRVSGYLPDGGGKDAHTLAEGAIAHLDKPNVPLVQDNNGKEDIPDQVSRSAKFLSVDPASPHTDEIAEHCSFEYSSFEGSSFECISFEYTSGRAEKMAPFGGGHMSSAKAFFGKWPKRDFRTELADGQIRRVERKALDSLGDASAQRSETGAGQNPARKIESTLAGTVSAAQTRSARVISTGW